MPTLPPVTSACKTVASILVPIILCIVLLGPEAGADVSIVDAPSYVQVPDDGDYGLTAAVEVAIDGPVSGHLRVQLLSEKKIVNRMWNGSAWTYPFVFDRALPISSDGNWTGLVCVRLYAPYFPDRGVAERLTVRVTYKNATVAKSSEAELNTTNASDLATVDLMAYDGVPLSGAAVRVNGTVYFLTSVGDATGREGDPWAGHVSIPVPPGPCTIGAGPFMEDVDLGPGDEVQLLLGSRGPSPLAISEVCFDPRGNLGWEWIELHANGTSNLTGFTMTDGEVTVDLPGVEVDGEFVIAFDNSSGLADGVLHLPMTGVLANDGDEITLIDPAGGIADHVSYGSSARAPPFLWDLSNNPGTGTGCIVRRDLAGVPDLGPWCEEWWGNATPGYLPFPHMDGPLLIVEAFYDTFTEGEDDEFVVIENVGNATLDLSDWELTDWEDLSPLNGSIGPGELLVVTRNLTPVLLREPDFLEMRTPCAVGPSLDIRLANDGDEIVLRHRKGIVDVMVYGDGTACPGWQGAPVPAAHEGEFDVRGKRDTNSSADWTPGRFHRLGQSRFHPDDLTADSLVAMVTPDCGDGPLLEMMDGARSRILVEAYEVLSPWVALSLSSAAGRGVNVSVLLDGAPVGWTFWNVAETEYLDRPGSFERAYTEKHLTGTLVEAGADVRFHGSNGPRYEFIHSKCIVADDTVLVSSDNLVEGSYPHGPEYGGLSVHGSRGWALILEGAEVASYFARVITHDMEGHDVVVWGTPPYDAPPGYFDTSWSDGLPDNGSGHTSDGQEPRPFTVAPLRIDRPVSVVPVLSPDTSNSWPIVSMIENATARVHAELLDLNANWSRAGSNRYLDALLDAASRGVDVRILLDPTWAAPGGSFDNHEMADVLTAASNGFPTLQCKLLSPHGLTMLHNKGVIADDRVLVSSINWGFNSVFRNRETAVIVTDAEVADHFDTVFMQDWNRSILDHVGVSLEYDGEYGLRLNGLNGSRAVVVTVGGTELYSGTVREGETLSIPLGSAGGNVCLSIDGPTLVLLSFGAGPRTEDAGRDGHAGFTFPPTLLIVSLVVTALTVVALLIRFRR